MDFADAIARQGEQKVRERYGNLFHMYQKITDENPYKVPMRIFPAVHYTMGGLWVDYDLQSTVKGLFVVGEANFSDHGANRLGASALMQGLADGYFILPYTLSNFLAREKGPGVDTEHESFEQAESEVRATINRLLNVGGRQSVDSFHRRLGKIMWDECGMARTTEGLQRAIEQIPALREEFWQDVKLPPGGAERLNQQLEHAGRVADFLEFGELMCRDALTREESAGGHFREEHQTDDGEAKRDDEHFAHTAVWEYKGAEQVPTRHKEQLEFENVELTTRSYK